MKTLRPKLLRENGEAAGGARRPRRRKRITVIRLLRGLFRYLCSFPTKTLVVFGASCAALLVGVMLLVTLLPKRNTDVTLPAVSAVTPTPSIAPTDVPPPTPEATPTLHPLDGAAITVGTHSDLIPAVQERLVKLGYMTVPAEGYTTRYGPATKTAVLLFQIKNFSDSLQWDGQLGPGTYELLMSDAAKAYYLGRGDGDSRTKEITKLVEDVKKLQDRLIQLGYLTITMASGYYEESTVTAVMMFQQYHGLKQDGRAGQETLALLYSDAAMDAQAGKLNDRSKLPKTPEPPNSPSPETSPAT